MSGQTRTFGASNIGVLHLQWRAGQSSGQTNARHNRSPCSPTLQWRAEQSPGQTLRLLDACNNDLDLQWRAGQLSGQTYNHAATWVTILMPSMEGRTIVRPDLLGRLRSMRQTASFNGGPDNCPARRESDHASA